MGKIAKSPGPAPSAASLNEAALSYISRYATTEAGLARFLGRRVHRWARAASDEGQEVDSVVPMAEEAARRVARSMVEKGLIDDRQFASARTARLARAGQSRRAVAAHLVHKGVPAETARAALPEPEQEISAALAYASRRRLGPFRVLSKCGSSGPENRQRDLGLLARAGFPRDVAERALQMPRETADTLLLALKHG